MLIHKPYPTRDNFFSQVGLYQFSVYGKEEPTNLKLLSRVNESAEEGEDNFVGEKIAELKAIKAEAIQAEDYDRANICK